MKGGEREKFVFCLFSSGLISEHKHPIVLIQFLNEWGDRQVVPYCTSSESSVRVDGKGYCAYIYTCMNNHSKRC